MDKETWLVGYSPKGCKESDTTEATLQAHIHILEMNPYFIQSVLSTDWLHQSWAGCCDAKMHKLLPLPAGLTVLESRFP